MSIITIDSRIEKKLDVTKRFNINLFNPCKEHGVRPKIFLVFWGKMKYNEYSAECPQCKEENWVFGGISNDTSNKWNHFNPIEVKS